LRRNDREEIEHMDLRNGVGKHIDEHVEGKAMRETASVKTNILLTPTEHKAWGTAAKARGMSMAEFIRRSVAAAEDAPSSDELDELEAMTAELTAAAERMEAAVAAALSQVRESSSKQADSDVHARTAAALSAQPVVFDPTMLNFGNAA